MMPGPGSLKVCSYPSLPLNLQTHSWKKQVYKYDTVSIKKNTVSVSTQIWQNWGGTYIFQLFAMQQYTAGFVLQHLSAVGLLNVAHIRGYCS